jgi:hypothetical protein
MMLKSKSSQSKSSPWKLLRAGLAGLAVVVGGGALTGGCLDRPVAPAVPRTSNVYVDEIRQTSVDKIDLLFMIDNSISMADKQAMLAEAVPLLVQRLITPICVRPCAKTDNCTPAQEKDGMPVGVNGPDCPAGSSSEFNPIKDIHVGVVTSSLGSHGAAGASDPCTTLSDDDHAHLLGDLRNTRDNYMPPLQPYDANGFLKWDQTKPPKYNPPGESNGAAFTTKFTEMVKSSGEHGCGFEASLEAWYRFLVDPEPAAGSMVVDGKAVVTGVDGTILAQRKAFLRPDSLVAVVMLSDENDCSIQDEGYGYLVARAAVPNKVANMYRSSSQCLANPNDPCCQSCGDTGERQGCPDIKSDSECAKGVTFTGEDTRADALNLRCWQQKRRFGFDLLYPTRRYSDGLSQPVVQIRSGEFVPNPLYIAEEGKVARDPGLVFLAGIVGVPWQDIADADSLTSPDSLRYLTAPELEAQGRWAVILGSPNNYSNDPPVPPTDPLMLEQPEERSGVNPITMAAIAPSTSTNPQQNPINGHEQANITNSDLQYACIFPLAKPLTCDAAAAEAKKGCDCFDDDLPTNRPLCQPPGGGAASNTQSFAKAYPGTRHLQVLQEFGDNSIVASICPKIATGDPKAQPDYGYNPAVKSIIDRLKEALKGKCLPRPLVPNDTTDVKDGLEPGQVPCAVIEALSPPAGGACPACNSQPSRLALDGSDGGPAKVELRQAVLQKLRDSKSCGQPGQPACEEFCTCELAQLAGDELNKCQNAGDPPSTPGYCYINDAPNEPHVGNAELVKDCSADAKRLLRFVGDTPARGAIALVACLGASLGSQ